MQAAGNATFFRGRPEHFDGSGVRRDGTLVERPPAIAGLLGVQRSTSFRALFPTTAVRCGTRNLPRCGRNGRSPLLDVQKWAPSSIVSRASSRLARAVFLASRASLCSLSKSDRSGIDPAIENTLLLAMFSHATIFSGPPSTIKLGGSRYCPVSRGAITRPLGEFGRIRASVGIRMSLGLATRTRR